MIRRAILLPVVLCLAACASGPPRSDLRSGPPELAREFRAVWVATVKNIDWPSAPGLPRATQQQELLSILDRAKDLGFNAVILQVRPAADAMYRSEIEPWSEFLGGAQGVDPGWDPLAFAVEQAHARGLELHAWFNPYRARHSEPRAPASADHITVTHPHLVREYGSYVWMDPGEEEIRSLTRRVVLDVVERYDIDGVHMDDYFYPYPENDAAGVPIDFPDSPSRERYLSEGGTLPVAAWRRENVDTLVRELWIDIHRVKPLVRFGVSPFGIWRPGNPAGIEGFDAYEKLYADSRLWLTEGWVDYFAPQLYWPIGQTAQSFPVLLRWWLENNPKGRHIWPGIAPSRIANGRPNAIYPEEILNQIVLTRELGANGAIHFSMRPLMEDRAAIGTRLASSLYEEPALVPASPWLDSDPPPPPDAQWSPSSGIVTLASPGEVPFLWVVRARRGVRWSVDVVSGSLSEIAVDGRPDEVAISAVDRVGNESAIVVIDG